MNARIVVTPEENPSRVEGFCTIPGWPGEQSVISLIRRGDIWIVGSSMSFLSDIEQTNAIRECQNKVFEAFNNVKRGKNYCVTMSRVTKCPSGQKAWQV